MFICLCKTLVNARNNILIVWCQSPPLSSVCVNASIVFLFGLCAIVQIKE